MAIEQTTATQHDALDAVATFVSSTGYADLPEDVRKHAKYVWLDTVGAILGGSLQPEASTLARRLADERGSATILGRGFPRSQAMNAALVNGTAGTFLELDEGHLPLAHPAIYAVPAVLAVGEARGSTGKQLIEALVVSYEVTARLSWATRFLNGIHVHGCLGAVGAAIGVARLLGYDEPRVREAINVASCLNGATPSRAAVEGALVRNVYAGFSGHMGALIADLVESGFTGPRGGLSEVYTRFIGSSLDQERLVKGLGRGYEITSNYFKTHATCRHLHAPLDALRLALEGRQLRPEEVERVTVVGNSNAVRFVRTDPENPLAAKFSVPFAIATSIARNETGMDAFQQEAIDDPVTRALAQRVTVEEDSAFSGRWPYEQPARVEVATTSGETLVGQVNGPRGGQDSPVGYEEVREKFCHLTSAFFPGGRSAQAVDLFLRMEDTSRAGDLTAALRELAG